MVRSFLPKFSSRYERRLLALCKSETDEKASDIKKWNKNAVQYLVKKLKKNIDIIDELEKAISQECSNTKCVPIPKAIENRLLVSHRRCLPQVIYCRLWRWPDLQSHHQIKPISACESSNSNSDSSAGTNLIDHTQPSTSTANDKLLPRSQTVCVNPYHYERRKPGSLEPVIVPCSDKIPPDLSTSFEDSDTIVGTKAIPYRLGAATTITGATVRSLLSVDSPLAVPSQNFISNVAPPNSTIQPMQSSSSSNHQILPKQQQSTVAISFNRHPTNMDPNRIPEVPRDEEVYMSYENPSGQDNVDYLQELMPTEPSQQQFQSTIFQEPQTQIFIPEHQQQQPVQQTPTPQAQPHQHMYHQPHHHQQQQHLHQHEQPIQPIHNQPTQQPIHVQQPQQQMHVQPSQLSSPAQSQQLHLQQPQQPIHVQSQPQVHMQQQHEIHHIQSQQHQVQQYHQYQQPQSHHQHYNPQPNTSQQYPQSQFQHPHQQYHQQPQYPQQPAQSTGLMHQSISTRTEIARPYQFKQNKFAHLVRAMHESTQVTSSPNLMTHTTTKPYIYPTAQLPPQQTHIQYQSQLYHTQVQQQQQVPPTSSYHQQSQQHVHYPMQTPVSYASTYSQQQHHHPQQQYQQQVPMQMDYQPEVPMTMSYQQPNSYYVPVAGPSHSSLPLAQIQMQPQQQQPQQQPPMEDDPETIDLKEVPFTEGTRWCSITYHEYDERVGEKYSPRTFIAYVDGYTHSTCTERFCIGGLTNIHRNEFTEWVRRRIGRGVKVTYVDGEVYVECLCDSAIFVSCPMLGAEASEDKENFPDQVTRLASGTSVLVFSNPQFSKLLSNAVTKGFEAVYKLTAYCTFRVSFVKGWGRNYKRQSILSAPCWVEVQLNGPLQWIDKVLRQMRPPQGCNSTS